MSYGVLDRALNKIADMLSQTNWTTLNSDIKYRKKNGFIIVNGSSGSTTVSSETVVGTLPLDYRPDSDLDFAATCLGGTSEVFVRIRADGKIYMWATPQTNYWSFSAVFPLSGSN